MTAIALPGQLFLPPRPGVYIPRRRPWWKRSWSDAEIREEVLAAIGTPTGIGNAQGNTVASTTLVMTVSASVAVGQFIVVCATCSSSVTCTFSDSAGNTWTTNATGNATQPWSVFIGSCQVTNALTSGVTTITATFSANIASRLICAAQVSGIATSSAIDKTANNGGTATAWTSTATATTTQADELVVGACGFDTSTTQTSSPGAGYTELFDFDNTKASQITMIYKIVSATGAQTASGTISSGTGLIWNSAVATYKADLSGGGSGGRAPQVVMGREAQRRSSRW